MLFTAQVPGQYLRPGPNCWLSLVSLSLVHLVAQPTRLSRFGASSNGLVPSCQVIRFSYQNGVSLNALKITLPPVKYPCVAMSHRYDTRVTTLLVNVTFRNFVYQPELGLSRQAVWCVTVDTIKMIIAV